MFRDLMVGQPKQSEHYLPRDWCLFKLCDDLRAYYTEGKYT